MTEIMNMEARGHQIFFKRFFKNLVVLVDESGSSIGIWSSPY